MGGVFVIEAGKAKVHVMPDFCATPIQNDESEWCVEAEALVRTVCQGSP